MAIAQLDLIYILGAQAGYGARTLGQPVQFIVVKDKGAAVFRGLDIALDAVTELDCGFKGSGAVFEHAVSM